MSSVITQEIHIMKRVYGESVIDSIINTVETAIKEAPDQLTDDFEMTPALYMFADLIYDENGVKRLMSFKQQGPMYIAHIYNKDGKTADKDLSSVFCAYSIYDILEVFNLTTKKKMLRAPYITLIETEYHSSYSIFTTDSPKNYDETDCKFDYEKALNEIGKYRFNVWKGGYIPGLEYILASTSTNVKTLLGSIDIICNPHLISAGNLFKETPVNQISETVCGSVKFKSTGIVYITNDDGEIDETITPSKVELPGPDVFESYAYKANESRALSADKLFNEKWIIETDQKTRHWTYNGESREIKLIGWSFTNVNFKYVQLGSIYLIGGYNEGYPVFKLLPKEKEEPSIPIEIKDWTTKFVADVHAGTADYGNSSDETPVNQNNNQNKIKIDKGIEEGKRIIYLSGDYTSLNEWTSTNPNQQDGKHKWFALDFVFDSEKLSNGLIWGVDTEITSDILDAAEGENTLTLWLKIDKIRDTPESIIITDKNNAEDSEVIEINFNDTSAINIGG